MKIGVLDYGMGNIQSIKNAIEYLGYKADLISKPDDIEKYDFVILPGVGAFPNAMKRLQESGLTTAIYSHVENNKPILGICLGMQLLFSKSLEFEESQGLDLIEGEVLPFKNRINMKVPHMGWNNTKTNKDEFKDFEGDYYFVHSYFCLPINPNVILFKTNYEISFCSAVNVDNKIFGLQFHPEKSQKLGLSLLKYIITICSKQD